MAVIENPKSGLPAKLKGLHLFGLGGASCAQRVRFALGEKGFKRSSDVAWDSLKPDTLEAAEGYYTSRCRIFAKKTTSDTGICRNSAEYGGTDPGT